jgi:periplasmic copper chaperone A
MSWKTMSWKTCERTLLLLTAVFCLTCGAGAETLKLGSIEVAAPWARATPKGAAVGGAFMTITNKGSEPDRLIGGSTPAAAKLEVHEMTTDNGVMNMRPVSGGLEIKPGETVVLKPGSLHLMLFGLKQPLTQGEKVKATLEFAKAGKLELEYPIESIGAQGPSAASMPGMDHGNMGNMGGAMAPGTMAPGSMDHAH